MNITENQCFLNAGIKAPTAWQQFSSFRRVKREEEITTKSDAVLICAVAFILYRVKYYN